MPRKKQSKNDRKQSENAVFMLELLKAKRRGMKEGNRRRTRNPKRGSLPAWIFPFAAQRRYQKNITELLKETTAIGRGSIRAGLRGWLAEARGDGLRLDDWTDELQALITELEEAGQRIFVEGRAEVVNWLRNVAITIFDWNRTQAGKQIKHILGEVVWLEEPWEREVIEAWAAENFTLVKSLNEEYIKKLNVIVSEGVQDGSTWDSIMRQIRGVDESITKSRAKLLARDQVGTLNGRLIQRRQEEIGIEMYTWSTAMDERVRGRPSGRYPKAIPSHWAMEGKLCRWDDSTVYSEDGGRTWKKRTGRMPKTIPGRAIQCRCGALPYWSPLIEQADKELAQERQVA